MEQNNNKLIALDDDYNMTDIITYSYNITKVDI